MDEPTASAQAAQAPEPRDEQGAGPTLEEFASLEDALRVMRIPLENHKLIRKVTQNIRIGSYFRTSSYIKAVRVAKGPDLHVASGYTNGFQSRDEALMAAGDVECERSQRGTEQWLIRHPVHGHASQDSGPAGPAGRDYGTCPNCFTTFSATGRCLCEA